LAASLQQQDNGKGRQRQQQQQETPGTTVGQLGDRRRWQNRPGEVVMGGIPESEKNDA